MTRSGSQLQIAVLPGDGIGVEVMDACVSVLEALSRRTALRFDWKRVPGGANAYRETGSAFTSEAMQQCERADAILFGAMGLPDVRYADCTEIAPQLDIRIHLQLYAGVRPIRALPALPSVLRDPRAEAIDFVILREQTEGLYWSRGRGLMQDADTAVDTMRITRAGCERVFDYAFRLARILRTRGRPGKVTCVDKSGVLLSQAFMHGVFSDVAARHVDTPTDFCNIDAMALNLVRQPWAYDVLVTENMFGDILSDLAAGLIGGMGLAPSGDIGDQHAMFQPCHGTAPDIAGTGKANPTAMFLSAAMMLDWLGERHSDERWSEGAQLLEDAVRTVFAERRVLPFEFGGRDGTREITQAVLNTLAHSSSP
jgi:3-isopropylmalate dehydrogenase